MRQNYRLSAILLAVCLIFTFSAITFSADEKKENEPNATGLKDPSEWKALKYRSIGPAWGGRVARACGVPGDPSVYYFAAAAGGVWKTIDGGITWKSIFDDQPVSSMGSIALAPSNPNVIYAGSGEANIRGNVAAGNGIYKSTDGGKTWNHVWKEVGQIGTMVIHPTNPDIAFAAVLGHAFGPNKERGVYRTEDGGKTWQQVLKKDENTGASDVAMDPHNPNVLFAGLWQARRTPWSMTSGGPGSGLYVSRDGGDTWKQLKEKGLPDGPYGKIGVAVAPSDGRIVYALIEAEKGGLFRSDDGGDNWTLTTPNRLLRERAWYYSTLTVNPSNPNEIWAPNVPMLKSIDGGKTFKIIDTIPHGDNHDLWIDPTDPKRMIGSDDGGVNLSSDGGNTWYAPPLPISQFYHVSTDNRVPFYVAGAMQDIGTAQGPNRSLDAGGIRNSEFYGVGGGEAGWVVSDPSDPNIVYAGEYSGYISYYDHRIRQSRNISAYPEDASGHGGEDLKYRFQWTAPIAISPHNPKVVYHGSNVLFRTDNGGVTWKAISPDLTRNDKSKQKWSGGPITGDNTGVEIYDTIFTISESPVQKDLIWTGTDDGLVQVTQDGGKSWKNVTRALNGLPEWATITIVEPSHFDAGTAYVVAEAHRLDNMHPYLWRTTDFGQTWTRLDSDLKQDVYLHIVREDPTNKNILYVGTERGVIFTKDGGKTWRSMKLNMPTVAVHDIVVKDNSLAIATMGRSLWIFDHLSLLRGWDQNVTSNAIHLFSAPESTRWSFHTTWPRDKWVGENPPGSAAFYYWLKDAPKNDYTIDILDSQGKVINTLSSKPEEAIGAGWDISKETEDLKKAALPKEAGVQAAYWDLSYKGAEMIPHAILDAGDPHSGMKVIPGEYTVKLNVDGKSETTKLKVVADSRITMTQSDYEQQLDLSLKVRDQLTRLTHIVTSLQSIRNQLKSRNELLKKNDKAGQLIKDSESLIKKLDELEAKIHNPKAEVPYDVLAFQGGAKLYSRMSGLYSFMFEGDAIPTQGLKDLFADMQKELDGHDSQFKQLVSSDLNALNEAAKKLDVPTVYVP
jgi:photosystem II stability/assembly factor-like uncharacterized protein